MQTANVQYRRSAGSTAVSGATGEGYTPTSNKLGKTIVGISTFTDDEDNLENRPSAPTGGDKNALTSIAHDVPTSHDWDNVFTSEVRISEEFPSATALWGTTRSACRATTWYAPPGNILWPIQVQPDGNGSVIIALPATMDCSAQGPSAPETAGCFPCETN